MLEDGMVLMVAEVDDAAALEQNKRYKREKELISFGHRRRDIRIK